MMTRELLGRFLDLLNKNTISVCRLLFKIFTHKLVLSRNFSYVKFYQRMID